MDKVTESMQEVGSGTGTSPLTEAFTVDAAKVRAHVDENVSRWFNFHFDPTET